MCGVKNYNPGQYFSYNGALIRVESVYIDEDNTIYYDCCRFTFDSEEDNYTCIFITVDHDYVLKHFNLVFCTCEDCKDD